MGWTHFTLLLPIKDRLKREFYAEMCRIERWSTRTARRSRRSSAISSSAPPTSSWRPLGHSKQVNRPRCNPVNPRSDYVKMRAFETARLGEAGVLTLRMGAEWRRACCRSRS
ncbi:MAG: DUF1016 N-terminal domain-containing protein [Verrucomicrobiia bacterium]